MSASAVRALLTSLLLAGLTVLAVAATLDVLGSGSESLSPPPPEEPSARPELLAAPGSSAVETLRAGGAGGTIVYTTPACESFELHLPSLERRALGVTLTCAPDPTTGGWSVAAGSRASVLPYPCLSRADPAPPSCSDGARLREALGADGAVSVEEVAWLSGARVAAILRDHERALDVLAIFARGELVAPPALASAALSGLRVSPQRRHVAVRGRAGGVLVLDDEGRLALPGRFRFPLLDARALAFSPDEAWTALATRGRLYLLETDPATRKVVELAVEALSLEWR